MRSHKVTYRCLMHAGLDMSHRLDAEYRDMVNFPRVEQGSELALLLLPTDHLNSGNLTLLYANQR